MKHNDLQICLCIVAKKLGVTFIPTDHGFPRPDGVLIDWDARRAYVVEIGGTTHRLSEYVGVHDIIEIDEPFQENEAETVIEGQLKSILELSPVWHVAWVC